MDKKGHQGMSNMAGMLLVSSKIYVGEQQRGRRSKWDEGVTHESAAPPTMARREAPSCWRVPQRHQIFPKKESVLLSKPDYLS